VLGLVSAIDWAEHSAQTADRYRQAYYARVSHDHDHVHGANMSFAANAYWAIGGFRGLSSGEDVDLVDRLAAARYRITRDSTLSVATSTRLHARAPLGFSHHLAQLERSDTEVCA
jgi:hypothetical protein